MQLRRALLPFVALLVIANAPLVYLLDAGDSEVRARVAFFGLASKTATFPRMQGGVTIVPGHPEDALIDVVLDATRLTAPDEVTLRRLKGEKFFWVEKYPTVHFVGRKLVMKDSLNGVVWGRLTARGVTRDERLHVTFDIAPAAAAPGEAIHLTGEMKIDRRNYGMTSYRLIVGKTVTISLRARMVLQQPGTR